MEPGDWREKTPGTCKSEAQIHQTETRRVKEAVRARKRSSSAAFSPPMMAKLADKLGTTTTSLQRIQRSKLPR
jgi:hypothetical protein